jgi:O-antigen ligase
LADTSTQNPAAAWMRPLPIAAFIAPIIAAPSGRGLVPVLLIVGMWSFLDMLRNNRAAIREAFSSPLCFWSLAAAGLALLSSQWALVPAQAIKVGFSFAGLAVFGLIMITQAKHQSATENESTRTALIVGMSIALILLGAGAAYGLNYDQPLWGKENRHAIRTLSHAQTVIAVFLVPCLFTLWQRGAMCRIYASAMAAATIVIFVNLEHGASNIAIMVSATSLVLVIFTDRAGLGLVCIGAATAILSMPVFLEMVLPTTEALSALSYSDGNWASETHRYFMWRFAVGAISDGSYLTGFGADASRGFPGAKEKVMWGIELMPLHPHNGALQVWLELGALGIVTFLALLVAIFRGTRAFARKDIAICAALLSAYLVPWMLSYGIWQSWWLALGWLAAAIGRGILEPKAP